MADSPTDPNGDVSLPELDVDSSATSKLNDDQIRYPPSTNVSQTFNESSVLVFGSYSSISSTYDDAWMSDDYREDSSDVMGNEESSDIFESVRAPVAINAT